jgi:hypothetical protein
VQNPVENFRAAYDTTSSGLIKYLFIMREIRIPSGEIRPFYLVPQGLTDAP